MNLSSKSAPDLRLVRLTTRRAMRGFGRMASRRLIHITFLTTPMKPPYHRSSSLIVVFHFIPESVIIIPLLSGWLRLRDDPSQGSPATATSGYFSPLSKISPSPFRCRDADLARHVMSFTWFCFYYCLVFITPAGYNTSENELRLANNKPYLNTLSKTIAVSEGSPCLRLRRTLSLQ